MILAESHHFLSHWYETIAPIVAAAIASGAAMKYASRFVRAWPAPDAESSRRYRWWYCFLNNLFENPDLVAKGNCK